MNYYVTDTGKYFILHGKELVPCYSADNPINLLSEYPYCAVVNGIDISMINDLDIVYCCVIGVYYIFAKESSAISSIEVIGLLT